MSLIVLSIPIFFVLMGIELLVVRLQRKDYYVLADSVNDISCGILSQLTEVFAGLDVRAAAPVPRFGATWFAPAAVELLSAVGGDPWELVIASDAAIRRPAEGRVPAELAAGPTFANAMTKRMLEMEWAMSVESAIEAEAVAQALCMETEDFARAYRAFAAKQRPVFEGN